MSEAGAITLVLDLPPPANKRLVPVRTRTGATLVRRTKTADWITAARWTVMNQCGGRCIPYRFAALIVLPETEADIDSRIKDILDACQAGGAVANDKGCRSLRVEIDPGRVGTALVELTPTTEIPPPARARRTRGNARTRNTMETTT